MQGCCLATPTRAQATPLRSTCIQITFTSSLRRPTDAWIRDDRNLLTDTSAVVTTGQRAINGVFAPVVDQHSSSSRIPCSWLRAVWLRQGCSSMAHQSHDYFDIPIGFRIFASECTQAEGHRLHSRWASFLLLEQKYKFSNTY